MWLAALFAWLPVAIDNRDLLPLWVAFAAYAAAALLIR